MRALRRLGFSIERRPPRGARRPAGHTAGCRRPQSARRPRARPSRTTAATATPAAGVDGSGSDVRALRTSVEWTVANGDRFSARRVRGSTSASSAATAGAKRCRRPPAGPGDRSTAPRGSADRGRAREVVSVRRRAGERSHRGARGRRALLQRAARGLGQGRRACRAAPGTDRPRCWRACERAAAQSRLCTATCRPTARCSRTARVNLWRSRPTAADARSPTTASARSCIVRAVAWRRQPAHLRCRRQRHIFVLRRLLG
jgi:hypothetical protein